MRNVYTAAEIFFLLLANHPSDLISGPLGGGGSGTMAMGPLSFNINNKGFCVCSGHQPAQPPLVAVFCPVACFYVNER